MIFTGNKNQEQAVDKCGSSKTAVNLKWKGKHQCKVDGHRRADNYFQEDWWSKRCFLQAVHFLQTLSEGCGDRLTKPNMTVRRWHCLLVKSFAAWPVARETTGLPRAKTTLSHSNWPQGDLRFMSENARNVSSFGRSLTGASTYGWWRRFAAGAKPSSVGIVAMKV